MIFVSVYVAIIVSMYIDLKQEGYNVTLKALAEYFPELLKDKESRGYIIRDLLMAILFGALGTVGSIVRAVKARKAANAGPNASLN